MTNRPLSSPPDAAECRQAFERMPDLLDGRLATLEARELEAHAARCALCHGRLAVERKLFTEIRRPHKVRQAPLAAWSRFEAAIAAAGAAAPTSSPPQAPASARPQATPARPPRRRTSLRLVLGLQAAAIAVLSVALLWVLVARTSGEPPASYRTVSAADATMSLAGASWRVVFDGSVGAAEVDPLLAAHGLRIVAGPTRERVYTVAPTSGVAPRIGALLTDRRVRLVEPVGGAGSAQ